MDIQQQQANQYLTTEHFTLQTARSAITADVNGRTQLFLSTVSSSVVALAFIGQVSNVGDVFFIFAFVLFPSLVCLGLITFVRVIQCLIEDILCAREINRIRHFYVEMSPHIQPYFVLSTHDDKEGILHNMGLGSRSTRWQVIWSNAGMIALINSILSGVFLGLLLHQSGRFSLQFIVACGIGTFLISCIAHYSAHSWFWLQAGQHMNTLFPSAETEGNKQG